MKTLTRLIAALWLVCGLAGPAAAQFIQPTSGGSVGPNSPTSCTASTLLYADASSLLQCSKTIPFSPTFAAGTITTSQPATVTQTWNAAGVTFTADLTNITATAKATGSLSKDWQIGGTSLVAVGITSTAASPALRFGGDTTTGFYRAAADVINATNAGIKSLTIGGASSTTNVGVGQYTLFSIGAGTGNTCLGQYACINNSAGSNNVAIGLSSFSGNSSGNVAIGASAGQSASMVGGANVAIGQSSLLNYTGSQTLSVGSLALSNLIGGAAGGGTNNTAFGIEVLLTTQTGYSNIGIGNFALRAMGNAEIPFVSDLKATGNVAIGLSALTADTTGFENICVGSPNCLVANTTGNTNSAIGSEVMSHNISGSGNAALGVSTLQGNTTGSNNTGVGGGAGGIFTNANRNTTGSSNTFLGANTAPSSTTQQDHMTLIGADATGAADNSIYIGRTSDAARVPGVIVNTGITTDATHTDSTVCQDTTSHQFYFGSGAVGICLGTSSVRYKNNIVPLTVGLADIAKLQAVSYHYLPGYGDPAKKLYGFTAEQVDGVLPELVGLDSIGRPNSVDWAGLVPVIVNAIKELKADNDNLRAEVRRLAR